MLEAVFLDRDGTIIEDRGWLRVADEVRFLPGAIAALKRLQRRFRLFMISNQYAVTRGTVPKREADRVNGHILLELHREGVCIEDLCACDSTEPCCKCHRPSADFLAATVERYGLDAERCWTVGDHPHDAELGSQMGGRGVLVLTGHGAQHRHELPAYIAVAADLTEATRIILSDMRGND